MHRTIYDTPIVCTLMRWISVIGLRLSGWKCEGEKPTSPKYVLICGPHTSNWDWLIFMAMVFAFRARLYYMAKDSLFRGAKGPLLKWLGGLPIDRSRNTGVVEQMVEQFNKSDSLELAIPPEGTRRRAEKWKTGFYHVAFQAQVPVVMGFLDYENKIGGFGPQFMPTGDIEEDIVLCREFYGPLKGLNAEWTSPVRVSVPAEEAAEDRGRNGGEDASTR
jgi:1-acyl-sn-glycerol-3-phosphate acyltransferase